jgi:sigma-B regulation protein RsbU (phosphoserine phosphatase)
VAGKGVPAALYGAFASGVVRARAFERRAPQDLMARVNRTLRRRGVEGLFCTLGYAFFDFGARTVRIANSGLPYPLRFRAATGTCEPLEVAGLPLGAFPDAAYDELLLDLAPGDAFVFHTDGVSDARSGGEEYGTGRLAEVVKRFAALPAPELGDRIVADVEEFMGDAVRGDDITLIVVKIL